MNRFLYLILTLLLMPIAAIGQSTAILDGIGLANGKSYTNYIKNPNAQKNTANVTASNLTVARSIITPLYSGSEFNLTSTSTPWSATWSALSFDEGMKNRLCELQVMLRGTAAGTTTLEVLQNSVAVFSQTVVLDATNPKKYGGTFPCGDLTYASTVKLGGSGATTGAIEAGAVYLGEPVSVSSGAVVTESATETRISTNLSNLSGPLFKSRRVGDSLEVSFYFGFSGNGGTAGTIAAFTLSGLSVDLNKVAASTVLGGSRGKINWYDNSASQQKSLSLYVQDATNLRFSVDGSGTIDRNAFDVNDQIGGVFTIPISGWQATDIVTPEASLVEYASNSSASDADDTTSFSNDVNGSVLPVVTTTRVKRIRFQTSIKDGDVVLIEVKDITTANSPWVTLANPVLSSDASFIASPLTLQNSLYYGIGFRMISVGDKQLDILFGTYAFTNNTSYGAAGAAWTNASSKFRWRVKKIPAGPGSQSFYIQGPVKGGNSGNAIPAGYVGEKQTFTSRIVSAVTSGWTANSSALITLPAGTWLLVFSVEGSSVASLTRVAGGISTNSTNDSSGIIELVYAGGGTGSGVRISGVSHVAISSPQAYYAKALTNGADATVTVTGYAIRLD